MQEAPPKKLSAKLKVFCYVTLNLGNVFFSFCALVQGDFTPQWSLFMFFGNLVWVNFTLWYLFRSRDKASLGFKP